MIWLNAMRSMTFDTSDMRAIGRVSEGEVGEVVLR